MFADLTRAATSGELSTEQVGRAMTALLDIDIDEKAKADFLRAWTKRGETPAELASCAEVLLPRAIDPGVRGTWQGRPLLDCCGTGGGGLNLLNISTGMVFILAAMGIPVVKHGNRGQTKKSGSADVLEALGIRIDLPPERLASCLEEVGAAFLFAPAYHTSFSVLAPVRKKLGTEGQRTVFNLLGPLLNPARPDARLVGVFSDDHLRLYGAALRAMGCARFAVVCGTDESTLKRIGEASAQGETLICGTQPGPEGADSFTLRSASAQLLPLASMLVTDADESAARLLALLTNEEKTGLARETLLLNAAVGAWAQGVAASIAEGQERAEEALTSGQSFAVLRRWQRFSKRG